MIRIKQTHEIITMEVTMNFTYEEIFKFLAKKGYTVLPFIWRYKDVGFPNGVTYHESPTFTATKEGENQTEDHLFLQVFEKEMKDILKEVEK